VRTSGIANGVGVIAIAEAACVELLGVGVEALSAIVSASISVDLDLTLWRFLIEAVSLTWNVLR
jgi:hypothetical protein